MGTARGGYFLKDGTRVPGVTTVINPWHPEGIEGLLHWANAEGLEGRNHRETRDKAADAGTMCHEAIEKWIKQEPIVFDGPEEIVKRARRSFDAFQDWADQSKFAVTHTETPLISEKHAFGGTPDGALFQGRRVIADWKTSSSIHAPYLVQVGGGYALLWDENFPTDPAKGFVIVRFDREYGDFHQHFYPELDDGREAFLLLRRLYPIGKRLAKRKG